jgi:hypothetical protein
MKVLNVSKNSIPCCLQLQALRAVGMATVLKSDKAVPYLLALNFPPIQVHFSAVAGFMTLRGDP